MFAGKGLSYKHLVSLTVVLISPLLFIGIPVRVAFNEWFIDWEYSKRDFPPDRYGMDNEYRKKLAKIGLRSVLSDEGLEEFKRARLPDGRRAFNSREIKHMEDVKNLLSLFFPAVYVAGVWTFISMFLLRDKRLIAKTLIASSLFSFTLISLAGLFSFTNYELAFELFHNYVFDPYSWRFRYTDTLLRIYPMKFWFDATLFVIVFALVLVFLTLTVGLLMLLRTGSRQPRHLP